MEPQYPYKNIPYLYCDKVKKNIYYSCKEEVKKQKTLNERSLHHDSNQHNKCRKIF